MREMILIEDINVKVVPEDIVQIYREKQAAQPHFDDTLDKEIETTIELIRGKHFINNREQVVCIGMSKQVQDAIGLPFEAFDSLQETLEISNKNYSDKVTELSKLQNSINDAPFLSRLKYLFTGRL